jgi:hypothetical protein
MGRIEIRARHPEDLTPDVAGLGQHLGEQLGVEVTIALGERTDQVRDLDHQQFLVLHGVVKVILPWAESYAASKAADLVTTWLKRRWNKQRDEGETLQPREVIIYGPREEELRRVKAPAATSEDAPDAADAKP